MEHFDLNLPQHFCNQLKTAHLNTAHEQASIKQVKSLYLNQAETIFNRFELSPADLPLGAVSIRDRLAQTHMPITFTSGYRQQGGWLSAAWFTLLSRTDSAALESIVRTLPYPKSQQDQTLQRLTALMSTLQNSPDQALTLDPHASSASHPRYHLLEPHLPAETDLGNTTETERFLQALTVDLTESKDSTFYKSL